jgi:hypothetical protein
MKKSLPYFASILLIFAVIFVTFRSERGPKLIWKKWYGDQITWNGIVIRLSGDEYFVPKSSSQKVLHIGDSAAIALISVAQEARTANDQFALIEQACKVTECTQAETRRLRVEGVSVTLYTYLERFSDNRFVLQHAYLIEGADIWVAYTGDQTRFQVHKSTIDEIVMEIARKTKRGSSTASLAVLQKHSGSPD